MGIYGRSLRNRSMVCVLISSPVDATHLLPPIAISRPRNPCEERGSNGFI